MLMLGKRLKELREEKGLTQQELAKIMNLSQQTIGHYEVGRAKPDVDTLNRLANFFGTTVDYLLGRTDVRNPNNKSDEDFPEDVKVLMRSVSKLTDKQKEIVKRLVQEFINED